MKTRIYRVMENLWTWEVNTWYFYNLWEAEAFLYKQLHTVDELDENFWLNYDNGTWSLYEIVTEDEPLSTPMDQALRNVIDRIRMFTYDYWD